jgi:hypothetical protein
MKDRSILPNHESATVGTIHSHEMKDNDILPLLSTPFDEPPYCTYSDLIENSKRNPMTRAI